MMSDAPMGDPVQPASEPASEPDALLSRLRVIDDQPLESRAAAFRQLHDELQHRLEGGDSTGSHA
jgi:hypothetical protein